MAPELARPKLVEQTWLSEFLSTKGFTRTSPTSFGNGRATLEFDGHDLVAIPGDGTKSWRSDLKEASGEATRALLDTFLTAPSFLSQAELDRRAGRQLIAEQSLRTITENIRDFPETHSGQQLRRFLWSLYNGYHVLNLWKLKGVLDSHNNKAVTEVLTAWMQGHVPESSLRRALTDSGEMARWDSTQLTSPEKQHLEDAREAVNDLLRSTLPGNPQTHLAKADGLFREVVDHLPSTLHPPVHCDRDRRHQVRRGIAVLQLDAQRLKCAAASFVFPAKRQLRQQRTRGGWFPFVFNHCRRHFAAHSHSTVQFFFWECVFGVAPAFE